MPERAPTLQIQVDAITLNGFGEIDADAFRASLGAELSRLISGQAWGGGVWQAEAVRVQLSAPVSSAALGAHVAQAIYAQMGRGTL